MCYPTANAAASAMVYTVDPKELLRADRDAEARGLEIIGVFHSHTHTDAYPSPTDVAQAPDPGWHYVLVPSRDGAAGRARYRIVDGEIVEEPVVLAQPVESSTGSSRSFDRGGPVAVEVRLPTVLRPAAGGPPTVQRRRRHHR